MRISAGASDAKDRPDDFTGSFAVYLLVGAGVLAGLQEWAYADRDAITFPTELFIALGMVVFLTGSIIAALLTRRWRRALSAALAPPVVYSIVQALAWVGVTPTNIRFQWTKSSYERQIEEAIERGDERPLIKVFHWGERGGAAATNVFAALIYDESDEIAKFPDHRSDAWRSRHEMQAGQPLYPIANPHTDSRGKRDLRHLGGHFYLSTTIN